MNIEMMVLLLVLLAVVIYFWRTSFKYVIVGGLLGLVSAVSYYYITVLLASDNVIPMPVFPTNTTTGSEVYTSGIFMLIITYGLVSGALGLLVELGLTAWNGIQNHTVTPSKKKKK